MRKLCFVHVCIYAKGIFIISTECGRTTPIQYLTVGHHFDSILYFEGMFQLKFVELSASLKLHTALLMNIHSMISIFKHFNTTEYFSVSLSLKKKGNTTV